MFQVATDGVVTNTGGDDARVTHVTSTLAGLMLPEDKIKLDSIPTDAYDGSALIEFEQSDWEETDIDSPDSPAYIHSLIISLILILTILHLLLTVLLPIRQELMLLFLW